MRHVCTLVIIAWMTLVSLGNASDYVELSRRGTNTSITINESLALIGDAVQGVIVNNGWWDLVDSVTFPSNVVVVVEPGSGFNVSSGKVLTIQGDLIAGSYPIFSGLGTVTGACLAAEINSLWGTNNLTARSTPTIVDLSGLTAALAAISNSLASLTSQTATNFANIETNNLVPVGSIIAWTTTNIPSGRWLECNGQSIATNFAASLFGVIGYTYGGSGTAFNVPDLRGRIPFGMNTNTFATIGGTGGEETHVLSTTEMPAHTHTLTTYGLGETVTHVARGENAALGTATSSSTGSGGAHNTLPPYMTLKYAIKY